MEAVIRKEFILDGLCCPNCAKKIERRVGALPGVNTASVDFAGQRLTLEIAGQEEEVGVMRRTGSIVQDMAPAIVMREKKAEEPGVKSIWLLGLGCADCAAKMERAISNIDGVKSVTVDVMTQKMTLTAAHKSELPALLRQASQIVVGIEPGIEVSYTERPSAAKDKEKWDLLLKRTGLGVGVLLFAVGFAFNFIWQAELAIFLAAYLLIGGEVVIRAVKNISKGQIFDENFLMSIATTGAFAIGEFPEGVAVMLFYQIGEAFQQYAVGRSRKSITALMDIRPDFANLQVGGEISRVSPEEINIGEYIVVKPGEKIPLDGVVTEGRSALDTSALTGEALPLDVEPGSEVLSGSVNKSGLLTIKVGKLFGESTVSKILDLVQNASGAKAPVENFITKFARYYTPAVVFAAVAMAFIPPIVLGGGSADWLNRALVFLVVSCPCALVISIPLSFFGGIGGASRNGILVKGSNYLDALRDVDTVVFDKTGTLTKGVFAVTEIVPASVFSHDALLELAAYAECGSNHPIAASIQKAYGNAVLRERLTEYEEIAGHGVRARVDGTIVLAGNGKLMDSAGISFKKPDIIGTVVYLAVDGEFAGHIVIADEVKPDSKKAIAELKALGVRRTAMLTGDSRAAGEKIGRELGLDMVCSELLPQHKVDWLEKLFETKTSKGALLFVGDGINDAPVLARADVGVAMGGVGSDAAIEAADVVLMTDEPSKIADAIRISKQTRMIVTQNIVFALAVKGIILTLGAMGIATMWEAVFGDVGVALIAVLNAMRAIGKK
ncbi:MAG: cadmium-translocating P-type ATPase [Clostridiales bacterium]|jgi:Cd2+/Zn2+-exporting ATPase|nr:cadmium-translocating P-type ATPase [Clostridiales bacterium]